MKRPYSPSCVGRQSDFLHLSTTERADDVRVITRPNGFIEVARLDVVHIDFDMGPD